MHTNSDKDWMWLDNWLKVNLQHPIWNGQRGVISFSFRKIKRTVLGAFGLLEFMS